MIPADFKTILLIGSTGSIGRQVLEVVEQHGGAFKVVGLTARTSGALLREQAARHGAASLLTDNEAELATFIEQTPADGVVVAVSGAAGLAPTWAAIRSGKNIALANKETLVMDGTRVMREVRQRGLGLYPIDSEHHALTQLLARFPRESVQSITLTCSGGALRGKSLDALKSVTPEEALRHPTWSMGEKITIDSATWVNKGFEVIEAHHLFDWPLERIHVQVHAESRVHGLVELKDGTVWFHASPADMKIPIHAALHAMRPEVCGLFESSVEVGVLEHNQTRFQFESPDNFPQIKGIQIARTAAQRGASACRRLVEEDDRAVADFLQKKCGFLEIYERLESVIMA